MYQTHSTSIPLTRCCCLSLAVKYQGASSGDIPAIPMEPGQPIPEAYEPLAAPKAVPFTVSLGGEDLVVVALAVMLLVSVVALVWQCCKTKWMKMAKVGGKVHVYQGVNKPINASDTELDDSL